MYWLTWADMITLLMTFFVVLASMGKIAEDDKFKAVVESMQETFGYFTPGSKIDMSSPGMNSLSLVNKLQEAMGGKQGKNRAANKSPRPGQVGQSAQVRNIRDGLMITVGGVTAFDEGSAALLPAAKEDLLQVTSVIKGYRNKVQVRGHTSRRALPAGSPFKDHVELSYARARAVAEFLTANDIKSERLTLEACADHEPVKVTAYDEEGVARNRRVEIVVKDAVVEDYKSDAADAETVTK